MEVNNTDLQYIYKFSENNTTTSSSNRSTNNADLDKNAFLRLLTVQLANQDPLNPMEDREFIVQLAQFSTLEQIQNLNTTITAKSEEILDALTGMNNNQVDANIELLKELINIRKAIEAYGMGISLKQTEIAEDVVLENESES
ncbi:MAG TPA: flagellar hook capping FlgD N-terminal domain-containing protein [Tissierellaceae bacterium]